jgi:hypothetical protein
MCVVFNNITLTVAILHDDEDGEVLEDSKAIFYAAAELAVRHFSLMPESHTNSQTMT